MVPLQFAWRFCISSFALIQPSMQCRIILQEKSQKTNPFYKHLQCKKFIKKIKVDEKDHKHANQQHNDEAKLETYNAV
jgi:hypothetical protein